MNFRQSVSIFILGASLLMNACSAEIAAPTATNVSPTPTLANARATDALPSACNAIQEIPDEGRAHTTPGETPTYQSNPPTSGTHNPTWHPTGIYDARIDVAMEVHNLEHGYVIIHYNDIGADQIKQLDGIVRSDFRKSILAPYPTMTYKIALTAWNHLQTCTAVDETVVRAFIQQFRDQGPEPGAP